ncbi:MAG: glycosyltransferase family 9 protein [Proteobacteria bacterium]|nr:lipopolysaccharide heptosyltransferase family protein [Pseudomonadota bacterium]NOG60708.1 glycosyltransferase family 9 protein [Pseudomonadota bacterium]
MKILIIKLGALGDTITSTSIINQISKHHHKDQVYLLTSSQFECLFSNFKSLTLCSFDRKTLSNKIKSILWIRKQQFDRIYDLQSNDRTTLYCALSGSPFRAGNHPRFPYHVHPKTKYIGECHSFDRLNQILESANIEKAEPLPFLPVPEDTAEEVSGWLNDHALFEKPYVLLHAGSSPLHPEKRWPYFLELALAIKDNFNVIWIGGDDDKELNIELSAKTGINATSAFSILGLVELGKKARFAVTNDSAPMHILSCAQIPVFGLFGPTYARRTHALGQLDNVITPNDQIAQNDHQFIPQDIANISVDTVLNKLKANQLL